MGLRFDWYEISRPEAMAPREDAPLPTRFGLETDEARKNNAASLITNAAPTLPDN